MYRDEISRKDLKFKLKAQALNIGSGGGSTAGSVPKFSDFAVLEELTEEEVQLWSAANASISSSITGGHKLNKKVLEKLCYLASDDGSVGRYALVRPENILEFDGAGNILGIESGTYFFLAKNSSKWGLINVPDSVSDDYFYYLVVQNPS